MESIQELKAALKKYYNKRFIYQEPIQSLIEYGKSMMYSIERDPELFFSMLNARDIHMYNYFLDDIIKYDFEQMSASASAPISPERIPRSIGRYTRRPRTRLPFDLHIGNGNQGEDRGDTINDVFLRPFIAPDVPHEINREHFEQPPARSTPIRTSRQHNEEITTASNIVARRAHDSARIDVGNAIPTENSISNILPELQIHDTPHGYDTNEELRPTAGFEQVSLPPELPESIANQTSSRSFALYRTTDTGLTRSVPAGPIGHSTPITSIHRREVGFETVKSTRDDLPIVTLPDFGQDDEFIREIEELFIEKRREQASQPRRSQLPRPSVPVLAPSFAVYAERNFGRRIVRPRENPNINKFSFIADMQNDIINNIDIQLANTIDVPPPPRGRSRINTTGTSSRPSPLETSAQRSRRFQESTPLIRENAIEEIEFTQISPNVQEQFATPKVGATMEGIEPPPVLPEVAQSLPNRTEEGNREQLTEISQNIQLPNVTMGQEQFQSVDRDQIAHTTPQLGVLGQIQQPPIIEEVTMPPIIEDVSIRREQEGLFRNWYDILRDRNSEEQPNYYIPSEPLHRKIKRRRLNPPRERLADPLPAERVEESAMEELPLQRIEGEIETSHFRQQFQQWKHMVLENARTGNFLNVPKYSIRLADIQIGRAINEIWNAVITKGNVERSVILPRELSRREALIRVKVLLELQSQNIVYLLTDGTQLRSITLNRDL